MSLQSLHLVRDLYAASAPADRGAAALVPGRAEALASLRLLSLA